MTSVFRAVARAKREVVGPAARRPLSGGGGSYSRKVGFRAMKLKYTPQIVNKVAICPGGNLPYIQITSIVLPYSQCTNYLVGTYLSWRKSTLYPYHLYSATLYPVTL